MYNNYRTGRLRPVWKTRWKRNEKKIYCNEKVFARLAIHITLGKQYQMHVVDEYPNKQEMGLLIWLSFWLLPKASVTKTKISWIYLAIIQVYAAHNLHLSVVSIYLKLRTWRCIYYRQIRKIAACDQGHVPLKFFLRRRVAHTIAGRWRNCPIRHSQVKVVPGIYK